ATRATRPFYVKPEAGPGLAQAFAGCLLGVGPARVGRPRRSDKVHPRQSVRELASASRFVFPCAGSTRRNIFFFRAICKADWTRWKRCPATARDPQAAA